MLRLAVSLVVCSVALASDDKADADLLQPKSVWKGMQDPDDRRADRKALPAALRVLERDGEKFVAQYWVIVVNGRRGVKIEGTVHNGKIEAKVTEILRGAKWDEDITEIPWTGQIKDEEMILQCTNMKEMTTTTRLKLVHDERKSPGN